MHRLSWKICGVAGVLLWSASCGKTPEPPTPPPVDQAQPEAWDDALRMAPLEDLDPDPDVVEVVLEAKVATLEVQPGLLTEAWTYNGSLPGPLIRVRKGQRLVVRFTNSLPEDTTVHWHGLRVPAAMDGSESTQTPTPPGGTFRYEFDVPDAGTYWYHPHIRSSAQVGFGLYGALVVEDVQEAPEEVRVPDVALVLSDIGIEADGTLTPADSSGSFGDYFGREGNTLLVNGRILPALKVRPGVAQRWRVVNASRSRYWKFALPGIAVIRIGGDAGLLERPVGQESVTLVPGERAELFVLPPEDMAPGEHEVLAQDANRFVLPHLTEPVPFMRLVVEGAPGTGAPTLPATLRAQPEVDVTGARSRPVVLTEHSDNGALVLGINGETMEQAEPFMAHVNTVEVWELGNTTNYHHPFHLHGFFFRVLTVNGKAPALSEWKDTIDVPPGSTLRVAIPFDDRPGMWMFHCHILDHADLGMMGMLHLMP